MQIQYIDSYYNEVRTLEVGSYPSGEPVISWEADSHWENVVRILLRPTNFFTFMACLIWVDALWERYGTIPELVLPFVPGARQDRLNDDGDFLFTIKSVAKEINARHFSKVIVLDAHSDVTPALINRCEVIHPSDYLRFTHFNFDPTAYEYVISPDAGAEKRSQAVAQALGIPLLHGWKHRDVANGKLNGFGFEGSGGRRPQGKLSLLVDDICDGGGTFVGLARACLGYEIPGDLYVSHGIFSKGTEELLKYFQNIITTDSILHTPMVRTPENVKVIPICDQLLRKGKL